MPAPEPIAPGDLIGIPLRDATIAAVIAETAGDRAFVVCFGPPLDGTPQTLPAEYVPETTSYFVTETLPLYDGSWLRYGPAPAWALAQIVPMPRFKATLPDGRRVLVRRSEEDLLPADLAESFDEAEFADAPSYLPPEASLFEVAVANTFGITPPVPPADPALDSRRRTVLKMLREIVADPALALRFEHVLSFEDASAADTAMQRLTAEGCEVRSVPSDSGRTSLEVVVPCPPEYPALIPTVRTFEALAAEFGGIYEGFGAETG